MNPQGFPLLLYTREGGWGMSSKLASAIFLVQGYNILIDIHFY